MGINKAILVGHVGKDPEVQYVKDDVPVARFTLATSENYKDKNGQKVTNTEWHNITVWRGLAKVVEQYVKKGDQLFIEGKISTRSYEKDGQTKYFTEIVANNIEMLGKRQTSSDINKATNEKEIVMVEETEGNLNPSIEPMEADDLPF